MIYNSSGCLTALIGFYSTFTVFTCLHNAVYLCITFIYCRCHWLLCAYCCRIYQNFVINSLSALMYCHMGTFQTSKVVCTTKSKIFTCHRHQTRAAKITRPKIKLTTMMKTFTSAEGFWVKRASTTTCGWTTPAPWSSATLCRKHLQVNSWTA